MAITAHQERFFAILELFPRITVYWDQEAKELNIAGLEQDLPAMSSGEQAIARFLGGVWLGKNHFDFDVLAHVGGMDEAGKRVFHAWVDDPFFP